MSRTIYDIANDMAALAEILEAAGGDISGEEAETALAAWERELEFDFDGKIDQYCVLIKEFEARSEARQKEADRLRTSAKTIQRSADSMRDRLRFIFEARGIKRVNTDRFNVSLAKNGGAQALVISKDYGTAEMPAWAIKHVSSVEVDAAAIRERLDAGEVLEFATLAPRTNRISIK